MKVFRLNCERVQYKRALKIYLRFVFMFRNIFFFKYLLANFHIYCCFILRSRVHYGHYYSELNNFS